MPPKKSKEVDVSNSAQQTSDHELFLQAFEKPTQIYRYLKTRLVNTPIFLNRNLTYMKHRMSRTHTARKTFTVDSMLEKIKAKQTSLAKSSKEYLTVSYIGYFDKNAEFSENQIKVDTMLLKLCHKKRKDVKCPVFTENIGTSYISVNPSEDSSVPKVLNTLNISSDRFNVNSNYTVKSYHLIISVVREDSTSLPAIDGAGNALALNNNTSSTNSPKTQLGASIVILDKLKQPLLDGEYEIQLESYSGLLTAAAQNNNAAHFAADFSAASWEPLDKVEDIATSGLEFQDYSETPKIKVRLGWSSEPMKTIVHMKPGLESGLDSTTCNKENNRPDGLPSSRLSLDLSSSNTASSITTVVNHTHSTSLVNSLPAENDDQKPIKVVYQFVYNNNSRQQTTACDDFKCPWCRLNCRFLYSLVKHLRYCHPRFKFTYHPMLNGALIDVAINSAFNKGFLGAPHHLMDQPAPSVDSPCALYRRHPRQRCIGSELLVYYPRRHRKNSMSEFLNDLADDVDTDGHRPVVSGHNRLYHHTITCLPVLPKEMDADCDDQKDPKWLQTKTKMMIDEFTDVNEGEKELMKLWNLHVMKYGFVGDCQIPLACNLFLECNGKELLRRNLYRNFVLHLCNMFDFGLLSGLAVYATLQRLHILILNEGDSSSEYSQVLKSSCEAQRQYWIQEGSKRAPKLLEIRPPLSSPTGDGVRRKPAGNYSPAHSPSLSQSSTQSDKSQSSLPSAGSSKRKLSVDDSSRSKSGDKERERTTGKKSVENLRKRVASLDESSRESTTSSASKKRRISSPDLKITSNCRVLLDDGVKFSSLLDTRGETNTAAKVTSRTRNSLHGNGVGSKAPAGTGGKASSSTSGPSKALSTSISSTNGTKTSISSSGSAKPSTAHSSSSKPSSGMSTAGASRQSLNGNGKTTTAGNGKAASVSGTLHGSNGNGASNAGMRRKSIAATSASCNGGLESGKVDLRRKSEHVETASKSGS